MDNQKPEINPVEEQKLYKKASKRAGFKVDLTIYVLVNLFLWIVWFFIFKGREDITFFKSILFVSIIWSLVLFTHYFIVYRMDKSLVEKELKNLKREMKQKDKELENLKKREAQKNDASKQA